MPDAPELTVVLPHYGDPEPTLATLRALLAQEDSPSTQLIVVDDASPEPFPDVADEGLHGIRVLRRTANGGFGSAVNTGAAHAEAPLLLILNSDVKVEPTFLRDLLSAAAPWMPAVASPWVVGEDGRYQWVGRHFPTAAHQAVEWLTPLARFRHRPLLHEAVGHDTYPQEGRDMVVHWVVGACLLLPTEEFHAVGGFDERFFMNAEEVDLQRRLRPRGLPSVVLGSVRLVHAGGGSSDPLRRRRWLVESRVRYAKKHGTAVPLRLALSAATAGNLVANTGRQLAGREIDARRVAREEFDLIWRSN
ncbi:glycosyltransferase family 2 protein [Ornithinimicrobium sp. Y1847]|uniref:glycosyltransferase family 2 protein n=1 Tax=Ornithinimicrobium sp. Y1847 TaxID=3405419 RepID=UPI003B672E2F